MLQPAAEDQNKDKRSKFKRRFGATGPGGERERDGTQRGVVVVVAGSTKGGRLQLLQLQLLVDSSSNQASYRQLS